MSSVRDIRADHSHSPREGLYRFSVRGDTHFFRLGLGLWGIVLGQGSCSHCCWRGAGRLDVEFCPHVAVLVEFQRSCVAIPRDVPSEMETYLPSVLDWETVSLVIYCLFLVALRFARHQHVVDVIHDDDDDFPAQHSPEHAWVGLTLPELPCGEFSAGPFRPQQSSMRKDVHSLLQSAHLVAGVEVVLR